jgi:REP element-mobilizing transposase RayT
VPKYRCKVLRKPVVNMLMKDVLNNLAKNKNMFFYTMEVVYDHIYMFIEIPKNISVDYVIKYLKSQTARFIFLAFPGFRKRYPIEHL